MQLTDDEDSFPTELPTRPQNDQHRANRMLKHWARLTDEKRKLVEQLIEALQER